ncbi:MAG: hypothetical protein RL120_14195, partial [Gammaproteobacteria bacterium]
MADPTLAPEEIVREQVNSVFSRLSVILSFEMFAAVLFVAFAVATTNNTHWLAYAWLIAALALSLGRLTAAGMLGARDAQLENTAGRGRFLLLTASISGLIWGTTWMIMPIASMDPPRGAVLLWPCAMMTGAAVNYAVKRRLMAAFIAPTLALHLLALLYEGSTQSLQIAIAMSGFSAFAWLLGQRMYRDQHQGIVLKLANKSLQRKLQEDAVRIREQEEELYTRIRREKTLLDEKR